MCKPFDYKNPGITSIMMEVTSASSALHMYPDPIENDYEGEFLSDVDGWAKHSCEHMRAANAVAREVGNEIRGLSGILHKLSRDLEDTPEGKKLFEVSLKLSRIAG